MSVSFSVKSKWFLPGRRKVINMLKNNVAGDCLAINLEGDPKSWTKYFEQVQSWSEIEFLSHYYPVLHVEEKSLASKQHCTMQEGTGRYVFIVKDGKLLFWGLFKYILSKLDKIF